MHLKTDLRDPSTTPLNFTKSINLALSERGVNALRHAQIPGLLEEVMKETIPMRGRMIHGRDLTGELYEQSQQYDIENRVCNGLLLRNHQLTFRRGYLPSTEEDSTRSYLTKWNLCQTSRSISTTNSPAPTLRNEKHGSKS